MGGAHDGGAGPRHRPDDLPGSPVIIDTDLGGDPDDAVALVVAARRVPELTLVTTGDEVHGERARFARHFLDLLGRSDVATVAGDSPADSPFFCVEGFTPDTVPAQAAMWSPPSDRSARRPTARCGGSAWRP